MTYHCSAIVASIQAVLIHHAEAAAHSSGFTQRRSKLSGACFVQTLVLGWLHQPQATLVNLTQMAATVGVAVTPQGLHKRFTKTGAACLKAVLDATIEQVVATEPVAIPLLRRFTAVLIQDSSVILLPSALATTWQGCGSADPDRGAAAVKVQVRLDFLPGQLQGPLLQDGRVHDGRAPQETRQMAKGALRLADLGYFNLDHLRAIADQEGYWLTRWQAGTVVCNEQGEALDCIPWLNQCGGDVVDCSVRLGLAAQMPARLLAQRVPPAVANERRRRLKADAQRRGHAVSKVRLAAADWTLYLTNVPPEKMTIGEALLLGRVRWQIELLFKLWKSHGVIDESRRTKPWRILCEVYAKLIAMVLQHWILLTTCWEYPNRSLLKAAQTIRSYAMVLANALVGIGTLAEGLAQIHRCLAAGCRMNPRNKHPNAYQLLLAPP
jgi:hypothetical protein